MTRFDLMITNGTIKEFRPESVWSYRRRMRRRMRYIDPPFQTAIALLETVFWLMVAGAAGACVIGFPVMLVHWCLGM